MAINHKVAQDSGCTENYCSTRFPKALSPVSWNNQQTTAPSNPRDNSLLGSKDNTNQRQNSSPGRSAAQHSGLTKDAVPGIASRCAPLCRAPQPAALSSTGLPAPQPPTRTALHGAQHGDEPSTKGCSPSVQQRLPAEAAPRSTAGRPGPAASCCWLSARP